MNKIAFETKLSEVYDDTIQPLQPYLNDHAVLVFKCTKCGLKFFARPSHLICEEHQQHLCNKPLGDQYGERLKNVSGRHRAKNKKSTLNFDHFNSMIKKGYSYQQVAQELQVYSKIIKDHFEAEGLL